MLQCVEALQEGIVQSDADQVILRYKEIIIRILKSFQGAFGQQWTNKQVTRVLSDFRDDLRYNEIAIEMLIKAGLVNVPQFDLALAQFMDNAPNYRALNLATMLVQNFCLDDRNGQFIVENDFSNTIEMLLKINSHARQPPENLTTVIDMLRQHHDHSSFLNERSSGPTAHIHNGIMQVSAFHSCV